MQLLFDRHFGNKFIHKIQSVHEYVVFKLFLAAKF